MSEEISDPKKSSLPAVKKQTDDNEPSVIVEYEKTDEAHYSFSYSFGDDYTFRMDESDQTADHTDFVDAEFNDDIPESDKVCYALAAASGLLTGALSSVHLTAEQLKRIADFKEKDWKPIVVAAAHLAGYKKSDYKGAASHLFTRAVRFAAKSEKVKDGLSVLAEHPSAAGLIFSILTQFSGEAITLNKTGDISFRNLPDYYVIGNTYAEKIVCAVFYWLFALAADEAASKRHIIDELGIPKELLRKIKEFVNLPFMKNIPTNLEAAESAFSEWLARTIIGAELYSTQPDADKIHPLFRMMGIALNIANDSIFVLINECIVRSIYILSRVCTLAKEQQISSFEALSKISVCELLPSNSHLLSRMSFIASASFVMANTAGAIFKAIKGKKINGKTFSSTFFAEINIAGVGRFFFACAQDSKYWGEDIRVLFQRHRKEKTKAPEQNEPPIDDDSAFDSLSLDAVQARILYCLEAISVQYDIRHTAKPDAAEKKQLWLDTWKGIVLNGIGAPPELAAQYFVEDEDLLYDGIYQLAKDANNRRWFYLLTQELALFKPYTVLGTPEDKVFKKLKAESDYLTDQFIRRQTIVTQSEVDSIIKTYARYKGYVSGSTKNTIIGAGIAVATAAASGGLALTFAPGIAAAIAGEAVVGLHGAALTSASLAFVGGGSLAAGGLGMAGGTAIITGGGALIGLAGSGTASAAAVLLQTPSDYWVRQSSKLLTCCRCVLIDILEDKTSVNAILRQIENAIADTERELAEIEAEKNDLDKEIIRKTEEYLKYLKRCRAELQKMLKQ